MTKCDLPFTFKASSTRRLFQFDWLTRLCA